MSSPAVMVIPPFVTTSSSVTPFPSVTSSNDGVSMVFFVAVMFEAKFVKSFLALMVRFPDLMFDIPSKLELMFPERLLALLAMVLVGRLLEI